jgi:hypothetical protein
VGVRAVAQYAHPEGIMHAAPFGIAFFMLGVFAVSKGQERIFPIRTFRRPRSIASGITLIVVGLSFMIFVVVYRHLFFS